VIVVIAVASKSLTTTARSREFWRAQAASLFFSAACRKAPRTLAPKVSLQPRVVVGKLPTTAGWHP